MEITNILIFIIAPLIIFLKSRNDNQYKYIVSRLNKDNKNFGNLIWNSQYYLLILYFINLLFNFIYLDNFISQTNIYLLNIICLIGFIKRRYKLYNSIEEIYEGCSELTIIFYINNLYFASLLISTTVLLTSLSAGISKLKSNLWKIGASGTGFIQFLTLPSVSRSLVRTLSSKLYKKFKLLRKFFNLITILTPWIQIISSGTLLVAKANDLYFLGLFSFLFQIIFILMLYVISDLSWITSFYGFLVSFLYFQPPNLYSLNINSFEQLFSIFISIVFLIIFSQRLFLNINKLPIWLDKVLSFISFSVVPFQMFTEIHMTNPVTFHIHKNSIKKHKYNAFNQNGLRDYSQNNKARFTQALMYPLGDLYLRYFLKENKSVYKSKLHKKQCDALFKDLNFGQIDFFQHSFCMKNYSYLTRKIGTIEFNSENNLFIFKELNKPMRTERNV